MRRLIGYPLMGECDFAVMRSSMTYSDVPNLGGEIEDALSRLFWSLPSVLIRFEFESGAAGLAYWYD